MNATKNIKYNFICMARSSLYQLKYAIISSYKIAISVRFEEHYRNNSIAALHIAQLCICQDNININNYSNENEAFGIQMFNDVTEQKDELISYLCIYYERYVAKFCCASSDGVITLCMYLIELRAFGKYFVQLDFPRIYTNNLKYLWDATQN